MVCGLPDSGLVAKIAVDYLIDQLKPKPIAEIYSPHLPPQVLIRENGVVEPMSHRLYYAPSEKLLIYTGDSQPDRKSTRLNSSHDQISYAVFCLKKKNIAVRVCRFPTTRSETPTRHRG